jgi:S1-C subfamily serine protease
MEEHANSTTVRPTVHPKIRRTPAFYILLAGFIAGSFAGAAFGVFFALSLDTSHLLAGQPAVPPTALHQAPVTNEDTAVISSVHKVTPSVVSISVLKDVSQIYNQTGPLALDPFGFGFTFPFQAPQPAQPSTPNQNQAPQKQTVGGGTGFIISSDGLILTNRHVVLDTDADYQVTLNDGTTHDAKVLARDTVLDLAVLKIDAQGLPVPALGDSDALEQGETVIAIGNTLAEFKNTVTKGVVSGINRHVVAGDGLGSSEVIEEAIQTDAAINPGNSGGPLIDLSGRVVGVNTAVNQSGQSIGFAIPINAAKIVIDSVRAHGKIVRPWLGVRYTVVNEDVAKAQNLPDNYGALISKGTQPTDVAIVPGSPADKAGLTEGDVILEADGVKIDENHSLAGSIGRKGPGDSVTLKVAKDGKTRIVTVVLGELPDATK